MSLHAVSSTAAGAPRAGAPSRRVRTLAVVGAAAAAASAAASLALAAVGRPGVDQVLGSLAVGVSITLSFGAAGLLLSLRRTNPVGVLLLIEAVVAGANLLAQQYGWLALIGRPGSLPGGAAAAWFSLWSFVPMLALICLGLPLVFPAWRPGRLERAALWTGAVGTAVVTICVAISPNTDFSLPGVTNPLALPALAPIVAVAAPAGVAALTAGVVMAVTSQVHRYRRSDLVERLQVKWFAYGAAASGAAIVLPMLLFVAGRSLPPAAFGAAQALVLPSLPVAVAVAVDRRGLYEIDRLISRTAAYGVLAGIVVSVYLGVVTAVALLLGAEGLAPAAAGTVAAIAVFEGLRRWLLRAVDRLLYGERSRPYEALARLSRRLEDRVAADAMLDAVAGEVATSLRVPLAAIWLVEDGVLCPAAFHGEPAGRLAPDFDPETVGRLASARSPLAAASLAGTPFGDHLERLGAVLALPLRQAGALVGVMALAPRGPGERFSAADLDLITGLAGQAAAAALSARLNAQLRDRLHELEASRERLVLAQDEERRRIQRDLHDELGPTLASVRMRLGGLLAQASEPDVREELGAADDVVREAAGSVRRLVHDLRPLALEQVGLEEALRQWVDRFQRDSGIQVRLALEFGALPAAGEVAVYRIVQEALHNARRHGACRRAEVRLSRSSGRVTLEAEDDGSGLADARPGSGIAGMRERVEELGGRLEVRPSDAGGTLVRAELPVRDPDG